MLFDVSGWPLSGLIAALALSAVVITVAGVAVTRLADVIADRTGMGEALAGAVLLGGSTSLSGIVTSVTAAAGGHPTLAISNAVGGIAAQTAFLAIADLSYRRANLEHSAASPEVLSQGALLITLLALPVLALAGPDLTVWGIHPATFALVALYLGGLRLMREARRRPMWFPRRTPTTVTDEPDERHRADAAGAISGVRLYGGFLALAVALAAAGYVVALSGLAIAGRGGLSETAVGALLTAVVTSLPELVTTVAAVRQGSVTLAVGGLIGGNVFDTLFLAASDVAYRDGSLYHRFGSDDLFLVAVTIVMTGILLLGLIRREPEGIARIGFESALILLLYALAVAVVL